LTVILSNKVWQRCLSSAASIHADSSRLVIKIAVAHLNAEVTQAEDIELLGAAPLEYSDD